MKYISTLSLKIYLIFFLSLVSIFLIELFSEQIPLFIPQGQLIEDLYLRVCLTIVSSTVFYFIVVHMKEVDRNETLNNLVKQHLETSLLEHDNLIRTIKKKINLSLEESFEVDHINTITHLLIDTNQNAPIELEGKRGCWFDLFKFRATRIKFHLNQLDLIIPNLNAQLVSSIHLVDKSIFLHKMTSLETETISKNPMLLAGTQADFLEYVQNIDFLKKEFNKL